jgi:hypothetical protein
VGAAPLWLYGERARREMRNEEEVRKRSGHVRQIKRSRTFFRVILSRFSMRCSVVFDHVKLCGGFRSSCCSSRC